MTATVLTPTVRQTGRRWRFWIIVAVVVIVAGLIAVLARGVVGPGQSLAPSNAAPSGARALAQVLRAQGVDVVEPDGLAAAVAASPGATLLLHDPQGFLDEAALDRLADAGAARVVLLDPAQPTLDVLATGVRMIGSTTVSAAIDCDVPLAERAGTIAGDSRLYYSSVDAERCWADGPDGARVIVLDGGDLVVTGTTGAFSNEQIILAGNAAVALGLLGSQERLVWYQPTLADISGGAPPDIGSLSPPWVIPLMLLLILVAIFAAVWQGRRFGPLVVEPLPAIVRADETMRGRARLTARAGARLRAADALRLGTLDRLAAVCSLAAFADVEEIASALAALTGRPRSVILDLLRDRPVSNDAALLRIASELSELEAAARRALGGAGPH
jgi:hypothetical protein